MRGPVGQRRSLRGPKGPEAISGASYCRNALVGPSPAGRMYDVARDGRFLMLQQEDSYPNGAEYQVVLNWLTDVRARFARRK